MHFGLGVLTLLFFALFGRKRRETPAPAPAPPIVVHIPDPGNVSPSPTPTPLPWVNPPPNLPNPFPAPSPQVVPVAPPPPAQPPPAFPNAPPPWLLALKWPDDWYAHPSPIPPAVVARAVFWLNGGLVWGGPPQTAPATSRKLEQIAGEWVTFVAATYGSTKYVLAWVPKPASMPS